MKFCTWHDSCDVLAWAQFRSDMIPLMQQVETNFPSKLKYDGKIVRETALGKVYASYKNFSHIGTCFGITPGKYFVKWDPGYVFNSYKALYSPWDMFWHNISADSGGCCFLHRGYFGRHSSKSFCWIDKAQQYDSLQYVSHHEVCWFYWSSPKKKIKFIP